jgi:hypothetical protein
MKYSMKTELATKNNKNDKLFPSSKYASQKTEQSKEAFRRDHSLRLSQRMDEKVGFILI